MSLAGKILQNRYTVEKQIGAGGMGTVYLATDQRFGTKVAIKQTLFTDSNLLRAFEREAQLLNGLRHPALPRVSDHFADADGAFIVMEYIAGEDLSAMVERDGAFAVADVLRWADVLLDALDYLHTQKTSIVHRDIKPQNLKLTPRGEIVLLDFGLAKGSVSELTQASLAKSVFGYSRAYAPLEQIQGTGTDPRSDLYSLAATLYHLFTGKPPVDALTRATSVLNGNEDPLQPAHILNPKISTAVASVLHQAMALNSNLRPAGAAKMRFAMLEAEKTPDIAEFFDGATVIRTDKIFTAHTQLMNAGATAHAASDAATKITAQNATDPHPFPETTASDSAASGASNFYASQKQRYPSGSPVKMAAMVLVFGGVGFAAWYGVKPTFFPAESNQIQKVVADTDVKTTLQPDSKPVEQQSPAATVQTNSANPETNAPEAAPASPLKTEKQSAPSQPASPAAEAAKSNVPSAKSRTSAGDTLIVVGKPPSDDEFDEMDEEIETAVNDSVKKANLKNIPPEIRSNDPNNPIDQAKLKIYIEKKTAAARKQREAAHQLREENKRRAAQGLPPLRLVPPRVPKVPKTQSHDNEDDN